jgi:hypothetical protein
VRYVFTTRVAADSHGDVFVSGKQNTIIKVTPDGSASSTARGSAASFRIRRTWQSGA